jgi:pilus assembly protein Flp/PilA
MENLRQTMATEPKVRSIIAQPHPLHPCGEETIMDLIIRFTSDEGGTGAVEYVIVMTLIGIALMGGMTALSTTLTGIFDNMTGRLSGS